MDVTRKTNIQQFGLNIMGLLRMDKLTKKHSFVICKKQVEWAILISD